MGNNMREEIMILDWNQEPRDSVIRLESILNELETANGRIEERIRLLEAVTFRARQRDRWRQPHASPQMVNITAGVGASDALNEGIQNGNDALATRETVESGKTNRGDKMHLVAKALGMETNAKKAESRSGSFFDCKICLDMARDPILTCCGHLFCWPCFCQLPYVDSYAKECPECKGEVTDKSLIPIYGNGDGNCSRKSKESVPMAPPRPRANRIDGFRQQLISRGPSSILIEERIQQISDIVGAMGERRRSQDLLGSHIMAERTTFVPRSQASPATETTSHPQHDSLQVSRLLQGAASVSSFSSALNTAMNSAERLVEDLEAYSSSHHVRRNHQQSPHIGNGDTSSSIAAVLHPDSQTSDTATEINSDVLPSDSFLRTDTVVVDLEDQTTDSEINSTLPSSSSRRRTNPRGSDVNNGHSSERRRRRLR
ncbi:unnamed protein product [Prunus armeniaca]|uniref:E3 ubiquitin-protein ligase RMA n=1 Tax=Prunus armeniaca TaxID=36596 RepID=A0A6J5WGI3_PRUAR|nr:unnamed protein product [Prunus armeniaca]CAB4298464.1 unnamed protein product [Prunus armeniaca]